jgi:hypothetical protein
MAGLGWSMSVVMQEHLQNLVSLGYITATELATCRVPKDPTSPISTWGGGVRHGVRDVLRGRIRCAIPAISSLLDAVLQLGNASLDSFGDLAYGSLRDPV